VRFFLISCDSSTKPNKVATPILTPAGGSYELEQTVSISCITEGAEIRYTLDGSVPPVNSVVYTAPFIVSLGTTVKAYAIKPGMKDSNVITQFYSGIVPVPVIEPESGTYVPGIFIRIRINGLSSAASWPDGVSVRYTLDGTEPDSSSTLYANPFILNEAAVLKAKAYRYNWTPSPVVTAAYSIPELLNVVSTTSMGGTAYDVSISGNYAYVAVMGTGLKIYDISSPHAPVQVGVYILPGDIFKLELVGQHVYLARGGEVRVINVANPASPQPVTNFTLGSSTILSMAHAGNLLYAGSGSGYVVATDIANPAAPQPIGSYLLNEAAYDLAARDNYVYATDGKFGMKILDFSIAAYPELVGSCQIQGFVSDVSVRGSYAYATGYNTGLQIINVSDPTAPAVVGSYITLDDLESVLAADNGYVYVYAFGTGLLKINVNSPAAPVLAGFCDLSGSITRIRYSSNYLFLTNTSSGLQVVQP